MIITKFYFPYHSFFFFKVCEMEKSVELENNIISVLILCVLSGIKFYNNYKYSL